MDNELTRLLTFLKWPMTSTTVSPSTLSRNGLFYNERSDEVECFLCGYKIKNWQEKYNPIDTHKQLSPHCQFSSESQHENSPNRRYVSNKELFVNSNYALSSLPFDNHDALDGDENSIFPSRRNVHEDETNCEMMPSMSLESKRMNHKTPDPGGGFLLTSTVPLDRLNPDFDKMKLQTARLSTFYDWPSQAFQRPFDLAKQGFFYTGQGDRVQCAYCCGILSRWAPEDSPLEEHRKHFPDCSFHSIGITSSHVETSVAGLSGIPSKYQTSLEGASFDERGLNLSLQETALVQGYIGTAPLHPEYSILARRIHSYRGGIIGMGQTVQLLSEAGFYYVGPHDNVRCFHCDGGLKNWQADDDPWVEHGRWFPRCAFLTTRVSEDTILTSTISWTSPETRQPITAPGESLDVIPQEVKSLMATSNVKAVIEFGYTNDIIHQAIEQRLNMLGDDFPDVQSLLEAIFEIENKTNVETSNHHTDPLHGDANGDAATPISVPSPLTAEQVRQREPDFASKPTSLSNDILSHQLSSIDSQSLVEENQKLREAKTCKVCMDEDVNITFLPCGHLVCCQVCAPSLRICPICRSLIRGTIKTFFR